MTRAAAVVEALDRTLKARKITYGQVANAPCMSEASVKRMFSRNHFTLDRLDRICELANTSLSELAREVDSAGSNVTQLTPEQEKEIGCDRKVSVVLAMRPWALDDFHSLRRRKWPDRVERA